MPTGLLDNPKYWLARAEDSRAGIEVDDALAIAEQIDVWIIRAERKRSARLLTSNRVRADIASLRLRISRVFAKVRIIPKAI
jgi:hypothetical protein